MGVKSLTARRPRRAARARACAGDGWGEGDRLSPDPERARRRLAGATGRRLRRPSLSPAGKGVEILGGPRARRPDVRSTGVIRSREAEDVYGWGTEGPSHGARRDIDARRWTRRRARAPPTARGVAPVGRAMTRAHRARDVGRAAGESAARCRHVDALSEALEEKDGRARSARATRTRRLDDAWAGRLKNRWGAGRDPARADSRSNRLARRGGRAAPSSARLAPTRRYSSMRALPSPDARGGPPRPGGLQLDAVAGPIASVAAGLALIGTPRVYFGGLHRDAARLRRRHHAPDVYALRPLLLLGCSPSPPTASSSPPRRVPPSCVRRARESPPQRLARLRSSHCAGLGDDAAAFSPPLPRAHDDARGAVGHERVGRRARAALARARVGAPSSVVVAGASRA